MAIKLDKKLKNNIIKVNFAMNNAPTMVQLTKHINNLLLTYPNDKTKMVAEFKRMLTKGTKLSLNFRVGVIVEYYGLVQCQQWFELIYGWDFNTVQPDNVA